MFWPMNPYNAPLIIDCSFEIVIERQKKKDNDNNNNDNNEY